MAHLYITDQHGPFDLGAQLSLTDEEAHHALTVSRLHVGENVMVTDGRGHLAHTTVTSANKREIVTKVTESSFQGAPTPQVWLAQALAKGDRDEYAIQMSCELGIDGIVPFAAERSVSVWSGDKKIKGQQRWQKIMQEAAKQSLRPWIPQVAGIHTLEELLHEYHDWTLVVMDPDATPPLSGFIAPSDDPILIVVGPEGGLSPAELDACHRFGAQAYRLGETVLRTSSAGPSALAVLNVRLGRW